MFFHPCAVMNIGSNLQFYVSASRGHNRTLIKDQELALKSKRLLRQINNKTQKPNETMLSLL